MEKHAFIREIATRLGCDEGRAGAVTSVVFQELRNRLTPKEAADVAAQLAPTLKRVWQEGDRPGRSVTRMHRTEFLGEVRRWAALADDTEAERGVRAVFATLQSVLGSPTGTEGEAWDVFSQLPKDMKQLWLRAREPFGAAAR